MRFYKRTFATAIWRAAIVAGTALHAQEERATAMPKVVLVELFTSEGCSSCPPADALLRQLNGTHTSAGQWIVGISEHVTYWNQLGWSDPFSAQRYTDRQSAYGDRFGLDSVYTPQVVINGREQLVGSDRAGILRAIQHQNELAPAVALKILDAKVQGDSMSVRFSAAGESKVQGSDIVAVLTDDIDGSEVLRGENGGRTLTHVAVARSIAKVAQVRGTGDQTVQLKLPVSFHGSTKGHHLILFAQATGYGAVLGVDSQAL